MANPAPTLDYRSPSGPSIRQVDRAGTTMFYVPPLHAGRDSTFWICFGLATPLCTWMFTEPLLDAYRFQDGNFDALGVLLVCAWGLCGWLSVRASIAINPHWRLLVSASQLSFRARAAWKSTQGTWSRDQIFEIIVDEGNHETPRYAEIAIRLRDDEHVGLVIGDPATAQELLAMAVVISHLLNVPLTVAGQDAATARP